MRVRTTMLSLALIFEFPTFTNHKISITLLILPKCLWTDDYAYPTAKLAVFSQCPTIQNLKFGGGIAKKLH